MISFGATGSFDQLSRFVNGLYASQRTLVIDTISLTPQAELEGATGSYVLAIGARAFVAKGIGPVPAPVTLGVGETGAAPVEVPVG